MASRTYVPTLLKTAQLLCAVITRATPTIIRLYPENAALLAALSAANAACAALTAELIPLRDYGD